MVVALSSEAKPLIEYYGLTLLENRGFSVYGNDHFRLVVTGMGKVRAAAGTAYLASLSRDQDDPWLNVGIAGHRHLPIGTATFAHKITDQATGRSWYPPQIIRIPGKGAHVTTYDQPVSSYPEVEVCEMEAAAFYAVATRFSSAELVQCWKIISDNSLNHVADLNAERVTHLLADHVEDIDGIARALRRLRGDGKQFCKEINVKQYYDQWHFTVTQRVQLQEVLRKISILGPVEMLEAKRWQHCDCAKNVLAELHRYLNSLPVTL